MKLRSNTHDIDVENEQLFIGKETKEKKKKGEKALALVKPGSLLVSRSNCKRVIASHLHKAKGMCK